MHQCSLISRFQCRKIGRIEFDFFSKSDSSKNFDKKKIFLVDLENTTKVNRIFSASVFSRLSIPMEKKWKNSI